MLLTGSGDGVWAESNAKVSAEENAIKEVCLALRNHVSSSEVAEAAAAAMISLCLDGELCVRGSQGWVS